MRGGLDLCSPSTDAKVSRLIMRYLRFWSVRGDLQEGHGCASRCQLPIFPMPIPIISSTKSGFLCAFALRNPRFRAFRAQNRGFCALLPSRTPIFGHFEHKIEVFVRFLPTEPPFSGIPSTKSGFLCAVWQTRQAYYQRLGYQYQKTAEESISLDLLDAFKRIAKVDL